MRSKGLFFVNSYKFRFATNFSMSATYTLVECFFFLLASIAFLGMRSVAMTRWRLDRRFKGWIVSGCVCVL